MRYTVNTHNFFARISKKLVVSMTNIVAFGKSSRHLGCRFFSWGNGYYYVMLQGDENRYRISSEYLDEFWSSYKDFIDITGGECPVNLYDL